MTVKFYPEEGEDIIEMPDGTYRFRYEVPTADISGCKVIHLGTPEYDDALDEMGY